MYFTLVALPFTGAAAAGLLGRSLGVTGAVLISTTSIGITTILALVAFYEVALGRSPVSLELFN